MPPVSWWPMVELRPDHLFSETTTDAVRRSGRATWCRSMGSDPSRWPDRSTHSPPLKRGLNWDATSATAGASSAPDAARRLGRPTVGEDGLPGDERADVRQQEGDQRADLIRLAGAPERGVEPEVLHQCPLECLVVGIALAFSDVPADGMQRIGFHGAGGNAVRPDARLAVGACDAAGERGNGRLEAGVGQSRLVRRAG